MNETEAEKLFLLAKPLKKEPTLIIDNIYLGADYNSADLYKL